jgi:hypothetical protein
MYPGREIVILAGAGLTNSEIADRLFLSPRTVASHLYRSYPRLGIAGRYADSGTTPGGPVTLFTSPWPESLFAFRRVWPALAPTGRLVAVDLPGFGHSQGRPDVLTPSAMGNSSTSSSPRSALARPIWSRPTWAPVPRCSWPRPRAGHRGRGDLDDPGGRLDSGPAITLPSVRNSGSRCSGCPGHAVHRRLTGEVRVNVGPARWERRRGRWPGGWRPLAAPPREDGRRRRRAGCGRLSRRHPRRPAQRDQHRPPGIARSCADVAEGGLTELFTPLALA